MGKENFFFLCSLVAVVAACTPYERMPPVYFAETANVLKRGEVNVTGAGGGGADTGGTAGGGSARVRVGVGDDQEIRVEGSMLGLEQDDRPGSDRSLSGRLSWKASLGPQSALLVGAGFTHARRVESNGGSEFGGRAAAADITYLVSSAFKPDDVVGYAGLRMSMSMSLPKDEMEHSDLIGTLTLGAGIAIPLTSSVRAYLEGGPIWILPVLSPIGGYGVLGLGVTFGR